MINKILKKENIIPKIIAKSTSGFTNQVYFVDDYVIKFTCEEKTKKQLEKEISIYQNIKLQNIPKYISSGTIEDYKYLIITKLHGKTLYSIWHTLNRQNQKNIVKQIANILKSFNKINGDFLNKEYNYTNWLDFVKNNLTNKVSDLKELGFNTIKLETFINNDCEKLFTNNKLGLIYNDAHFDNFLFDGKQVYLIDFDRVIFGAIDYEMMIFKTMCDIPDKFASEEDYLNCKIEDYNFIYQEFKNSYPELFNRVTERRIKIYQFNYLVGQAIRCKDKEWINRLLKEFGF